MVTVPPVAVVDFETQAIEERPVYPPEPVGVSILEPGGAAKYWSWGHPTGNNCTRKDAGNALSKVWRGKYPIVFHNGAFDMEVALEEFGLPILPVDRWHDTLLLAYLTDPHAKSLALKTLAHARLGVAPDERDEVRDWILENVPEARRLKTNWGAYICKAPGALVGKYANGDCTRTLALFDYFYRFVVEYDMLGAYTRERKLIPILLNTSREGITVNLERLRADVPRYVKQLDTTDNWIRRRLKCDDLNIDSTAELAKALDKAGKMSNWLMTPTGARSLSKESIAFGMSDKVLKGVLRYREALGMCTGTFLGPWLRRAEATGGVVQVDWNSTRQDDSTHRNGTRTGRLSSNPNFMNIYSDENIAKAMVEVSGAKLPWEGLPFVRGYIEADDDGQVLCDRDFSQQELRVLASFEDGPMLKAYQDTPKLDLHEYATEIIQATTGIALGRKSTKTIAFGLIYGMGEDALAAKLGVTKEEARKAKNAYLDTFPGVRDLMDELKRRSRVGEPMRTWGGRMYWAEPPKMVEGRMREYGYKLTNYLIQGSSADITKEAILRYEHTKKHGRFVLTVHDEIMISVPEGHRVSEMKILREAMNGIALDAPLLSDGSWGHAWQNMTECE